MTHPLPARLPTQRNPAWRLYGDTIVTIDATLRWRGAAGRFVGVRCLVGSPRWPLPRAPRPTRVAVRFAPLPRA